MSSGCGFDRLTMCVCGTSSFGMPEPELTVLSGLWSSSSGKQWRICKCPVYAFPGFRSLLCTQFMVYALIQLSWILLRLFSTSYMSILHTVFNGLVLHFSGLVLPSWHFPKHSCTGSTNTIVDFVKLVTTIPRRWSSIGSYPMGEFAFVIGP